ncbi:lipoprotein releasing system, transmembrane protein [Candidatus Phycorickettsia trachydisci]|uniref:Lipoprotein releasing system, transmembrane protein n=1 Tax=Candidatus Phycorickettsia trachydisci TaxID=2115978 RepID=A0A2P1P9M8_9RICK|nr:lipoprotein-releasing ABC transporter permease subunit [Candidatus Phycorickettsia trachydisci]AVP87960.1 lipoprotein releasing system, transmembrane protein [Candidatus Phycorickettsia trachydisci]
MNLNFVLKIAFRYFFPKAGDRFISFVSAFSLVGTTIGVAALIIVMSIMNGFHNELIRCTVGTNGHIVLQGDDPEYLKDKVARYKFVTGIGFTIEGQGLLSTPDHNTGVMVKGLSESDFILKKQLSKNLSKQAKTLNDPNTVLLGKELAINLGLKTGDAVTLLVPETRASIFGSLPKSKELKVAGIISSGLSEYDAANIIIPIETAQKVFDRPKMLEIYTDNPDQVDAYTKILQQDLVGHIDSISNWKITNKSILSALKIEKTAMGMVLSLIIMVASFNIISSLFMLVKNKSKDIAILRTIGASKNSIMLIFMLSGSMLGIIGTFAGIVIAIPIIRNIEGIRHFLEYFTGIPIFDSAIYFLYTLPAQIETSDVILVSSISLGISFLATIYPAYRAANLNPVEILRHE